MTPPTSTATIATQSADAAIQWERDIADVLRGALVHNEQLLGLLARSIVHGLREQLGGQELRIPAPDKTARNAAIRQEYNFRNVDELSRKYGLSKRMIYKIVQNVK